MCLSMDKKHTDRPSPSPLEGNCVSVGNLETTDTGESSEYGIGVADGGEDGRYQGKVTLVRDPSLVSISI